MAPDVSSLRADARAARDELWAWALTTAPSADRLREQAAAADVLLDEGDSFADAGELESARARYVRVAQLADDTVAETLLQALRRRQSLRVPRLRFGS